MADSVRSDAEWRRQLTREQYEVTRRKGTEPTGQRYGINSASLELEPDE